MKNFGKIFCKASILTGIVLLAGCATTDRSELVDEVEIKADVINGRPINEALDRLATRGFVCTEGTIFVPQRTNVYECLRHRSNLYPGYECTHRLQFDPAPDGTVTNLQINRPACTEKSYY